ncbi:MAG: GntR family transcriptional regulator [Deltaproteobacteria bacterium]|nr:GntR family transcriptional regulator [Deltaproteobacteria bacterium]
MANKQAHQKVATSLMRDIFFHKIIPGQKLPPERELSASMNVDRTSLRVALKQLESMELLDIRPGDGIYVKDFLKNAGIDFLRVLFSQNNAPEDELAVDMFMIDEVWEWWITLFPDMIRMAGQRGSSRDLKTLSDSMDIEIKYKDHKDKLIELWLEQQDIIAATVNNMVLSLLFNSSRPLRRNMLRIFMDSVSQVDLEKFITSKKSLLMDFLSSSGKEMDIYVEQYRSILMAQRQITRSRLTQNTLPQSATQPQE